MAEADTIARRDEGGPQRTTEASPTALDPKPGEETSPGVNKPATPKHGDGKDEGKDGGEDNPAEERKRRRRSRLIRLVFGLVLVAGVVAGVFYWLAGRGKVGTDDAFTDGRAISIAPRVSGYVTELDVDDNRFVHKGDVLLRIDPRDYQAARDQQAGTVAIAKGQLAGAEASLARAKVTFPAQLTAAQGNLAIAQGNAFQAQADYRRQHAISKEATTQQSVDASTAALQQAQGQVKQAEAQVLQATPVPENIDVAAASRDQLAGQLQQAQAQLTQAELNLGYTVVRAPQDGWITRRNVEVGTYAQPGTTVLAIVSPEVWVTANFKEDQLDRIRPGQPVDVMVDAYPSLRLHGHVDSVQLGSGSRFSTFPAENATGNFVKIVQRIPVKIVIDSGLDPNVPLPLGLSVDPVIEVGDTKGAGERDKGQ